MTYAEHSTLPESVLEMVAESGFEALPEAMRLLLNAAMRIERQKYLGAGAYERTPERNGHANGSRAKRCRPAWAH